MIFIFNPQKVTKSGENSVVSYVYGASVDNKTSFDWIDIVSNGLGEQNAYRYYMNHDFIEVDLPFEFPFYGKKYSKMYVYNTGFVSFTPRRDDKIWPEPPGDFPEGTVFNNIIAPYWGLHSMNTTKTGGTYHYVTEDRAVVSFMEYGNSMNYGVCYQLILEKDGSFKFQYKAFDENSNIMSPFGLAGVVNDDASQFIRLPERYIAFNNAVAFTPVVKNTVAPGEKDVIGISLNTDRMAGEYSSNLTLTTNVPSKESVEIPVNLTITGEAKPVIPEGVSIENVLAFRSTDFSDPLVNLGACYAAYFSVANEGSAEFTVTGVSYESPMIFDEYFGTEFPAFMLFAKLPEINFITGEPTGKISWQQVDPSFFMPMNVGRTPVEFAIPMMESDYWMTPGETDIPVTITYTTDGSDSVEKTVNVKFIVTPAPAMTFDKQEIRVSNAADDHSSVETLNISNDGEYTLKYSLRLDPSGVGEVEEDLGGGIAPATFRKSVATNEAAPFDLAEGMLAKIKAADNSNVNPYDLPSDFDFNSALYYEAMPGNTASYNYGANTAFDVYKAAVAFKAPKEGINISHIYIPVSIEEAENVNIKFELISGSNPEDNGEVIGRGSLFIDSQINPETGMSQGRFYLVPLERPVYMNPEEEFCVVVTYPEGILYPTYLCVKEEPVTEGRYLGWTENSGWFDVAQLFESQYGSLGYILSCLETTPGEPWISLLNEETEGEIGISEGKEIQVKVNAAAARLEKNNKAVIVIKSNDPNQPVVNYPIYLDKNGAPVISAPSSKVYAKEGQTTIVAITVADEDGDDVTISLNDAAGIASIDGVVPAEGDTNVSATKDDNGTISVNGATMPFTVNVALKPEFGQEGSYLFNIAAADALGHVATAAVTYEVEDVNRAPEASNEINLTIKVGDLSEVVTFAEHFSDPDGDELSYELDFPANSFVDAFTTSTGVVFQGRALGTAKGQIIATDGEGLSSSVPVVVTVTDASGIDEITTSGNGLITLDSSAFDETLGFKALASGKFLIQIFDAAGKCVYNSDIDVTSGNAYSINIGENATGVHILTVTSSGKNESHRFIKR